jgi:midasin
MEAMDVDMHDSPSWEHWAEVWQAWLQVFHHYKSLWHSDHVVDLGFVEKLATKSGKVQTGDLLNTLCALIWEYGPAGTIASAFTFKPLLKQVVAQLSHNCVCVEDSGARYGITAALLLLCEAYPAVKAITLKHCLKFGVDFSTTSNKSAARSFWLGDVEMAKAGYRAIVLSNQTLSYPWNWRSYFKLLKNESKQARWFSINAACMILKQSRETRLGLIEMEFNGQERLQYYLEWRQEQQLLSAVSSDLLYSDRFDCGPINSLKSSIFFPKLDSLSSSQEVGEKNSYVSTQSLDTTYNFMLASLERNMHVILFGASGCGKTALMNHLKFHNGGQSNTLTVHMHKSMDSRSLIGTYVCTSQAGEFQWKEGPLTIAALQGKWLCIEEINAAPQEALALLASVGETNQINVPGKGMLQVKAGFTMFGLCTLESRSDENVVHCLHHLQKSNWAYHSLTMPSVEESIQIVHMLYPSLNCVSGNLIAMYTFLTKIAKQGWQKDSVMKELVESASLTPSEVISNLRCPFNLRHLLQFCNRLVVCHEEWINASAEVAPEMLRKVAFYHAFDLFCGGVRNDEFANKFSSIFLQFWNLSTYHKDEFNIYKPVLNITKSSVSIGRSTLVKSVVDMNDGSGGLPFVATTHSLRLLEKTALAIQTQEAILLVGETGIGKTACIQHLSKITGTDLLVLNMNQQSDSSDLVGSFRPVESHILLIPLMATFQSLVARTWPAGNNLDFFRRLYSYVHKKKWLKLLNGFKLALQKLAKSASLIDLETSHCLSVFLVKDSSPSQPKRARIETDAQLSKDLQKGWRNFVDELLKVEGQLFTELKSEGGSKAHFSFSFIEGILVKAMKEGKWLLIDEINLAPSEALEKLFAVLDSSVGTFSLTERGDTETIERHPGFRLFAAMNPGTDAGKKELASNLRGRFTEFYVEENLCREDLEHIISSSFKNVSIGNAPTLLLVDFYIFAKEQSRENLYDCAGQKPHYSLRTLCRALEYIIKAVHIYGMNKSIKDAVSMGFFTQLDSKSRIILEQHLHSKLSGFADEYHERPVTSSDSFVQFESFLLSKGPLEIKTEEDAAFSKYIVTKSVKQRLKDLSRAIYFHKSPILLQGPTSAGKTSLIKYIASATGYKCIRINNHANTDVQEYTGTYSTDKHGNIRFHEGPLVQALRMGHWVILDELNLAPSDVLEALNRLLDDNRELYVPEINETIKPHKNFLLFATQNPAGAYGGRKTLSRAFRNRFIEIYVDDIPENELPVILEKSCLIAASQAKRMVQSSKTLRQFRQKSAVFAGKHGFITPRDLLRWGNRSQNSTLQEMAESGYSLLAERLRDNSEKAIVKEILQKEFRSSLAMEDLYQHHIQALMQKGTNMQKSENVGISMGASMQRLFALIYKCWENREPVLLVGETGCGKTTACQMLAQLEEKTLHIYNCHQHSETSDFIGSYRPSRNTQAATEKFLVVAREVVSRKGLERYFRDKDLVHRICKPDCSQMDLSKGISDLEDAVKEFAKTDKEESNRLLAQLEIMKQCQIEMKIPFEWVDGPLVNAMKNGEFLLVDELSLAEDAVLERLNSVLEVGGTITLSEKGSDEVEEIVPKEGFFLLATMNPGGDFGKRELSPALRNRFTEIWVPPIESLDEICLIIKERLSSDEIDESVIDKMLRVWQFLFDNAVESLEGQKKQFLSIRDLVAWADFISLKSGDLGVNAAFGHGAYLVFQDGFGVGTGIDFQVQNLKARSEELIAKLSEMDSESSLTIPPTDVITDTEDVWGMKPFLVPKGRCKEVSKFKYDFTSCTVRKNLWRILRAMQMQRAILLEGSPGVGKSSMVQNLSYLTSNKLVRINLSEHTDMMDLLGAESPCDPKSNDGALFKWQDGPLLLAIKSGSWVLLDELNLAQQSVLEGLNALLDHRAEIFIPELNETFKCPSTFKVFATQNPMYEGGGRKGLPKSFLNRFTKVYIERLTSDDFHHILKSLYEDFPENILRSILSFNEKVNKAVDAREIGHFGGPWDFNFRDVTRCIDITYAIMQNGDSSEEILPLLALNSRYAESKGVIRHKNFQEIISRAIETVYMKRMRSLDDKKYLKGVFQEIFGVDYFGGLSLPSLKITDSTFSIGHARMKFNITSEHQILRQSSLDMLNGCYDSLESAMHSVSNGWMCSFVGDWKTENISIPSFLAEISGYELTVIKLSNCTDTSDLLGSFEQQNFEGKILSLSSELQIVLKETCLPFLQGKENETISTLFQWMQDISNFAASASEVTKENLLGHINSFLRRLHQMKELLPQEVLEGEKGKNLVTTIDRIFESINEITRNLNKSQFSGFNWIDGPLVEAIKFGKWILLEDCNLCNPAVLDRLNPLLEGSNSYFMLNESTGNMDKLTPHKDFRLFLSWNPSAGGEISRAMRNRGIEIFLSKQDAHREIIYRAAAKATSDFAFDAELISNMLIIFAENGLRTSSLSKALLARILGLMTSNAGQFKENDTKRKSVTVKNFLSALQYNCSAKSDWREKIEFAVQYAMALDPSMHDVEIQLDDTKSGALLDILKCFHGRLYKYFADALLEPGFLTLDSDSISMLPVFTEENGLSLIAKDEFKFALDFFLYSARSTDDIVLRRDYILFFLRHGVSGGRSDTSFLQLFICFLETEVPNAIARQIFKVWQDFSVESSSMGVQSLLANTVVENVHTKLESFFEQCLSLDDFLLQKVMRESMQSVQFVGDAEKSSVLIHSVAMLQSELSGDLEEFSDVKPVFKHMFPLFLSIHEFEKHVFENIHELWGNIFRNAFVQFQKQRHQIFNWMLVERIDDIQDFDFFIFLLVGLQDCLHNLEKCSNGDPVYTGHLEKVFASFYVVVHSLGFGKHIEYDIPLIYKAGQPLCIADAESLQTVNGLRTLGSKLTLEYNKMNYCLAEKSSISHIKFHRDILKGHALTTLASYGGDEVNMKSATQVLHILSKEYERIEKSSGADLSENVLSIHEDVSNILMLDIDAIGKNFTVSSEGHQSRGLVLSWKPYQELKGNVQTLADLTSFASELHVLPHLAWLCNKENQSMDAFEEIQRDLQMMVDFGIEKSSRCPLDFAPHQQILWLLDSGLPVSDQVLFCSQIHELSYKWFESFLNSYDNFLYLAREEEGTLISKSYGDLYDVLKFGHSYITLRLMSCRVPCILQNVYVESLRRSNDILQRKLRDTMHSDDCERSHQVAILRQLFLCYEGSFNLSIPENRENFLTITSGKEVEAALIAMNNLSSSSSNKKFKAISEWILKQFSSLDYTCVSSVRKGEHTGKVWLALGLLRVYLAIPPNGYDPALKPAHEARKLEEESKGVGMVSGIIDQRFLSQRGQSLPVNPIQSSLLERFTHVCAETEKLRREAPIRFDSSSYQDIIQDVSEFVEHKLDMDKIFSLLDNLESNTMALDGLSVIGESALMWATNMRSKYASYSDILQPLNLGLYQFAYGISSLKTAMKEKKDGWRSLCNDLLSVPREAPLTVVNTLDTFFETSEFGDGHLQMIKLLKSCLCELAGRLHSCRFSNELWRTTNALLGQYSHMWDVAKQKEDRELEEALALFKPSTKGVKTSWEEIQRVTIDEEGNFEQESLMDGEIKENIKDKMEKDFAYDIMISHWKATQSFKSDIYHLLDVDEIQFLERTDTRRLEEILECYDTLSNILQSKDSCLKNSSIGSINAHLLRIGVKEQSILKSYSILEMKEPVHNLYIRVSKIREEWPENELLIQLQEIAENLLLLPSDVPLKKAMSGVELLLLRSLTWEENAASHVSIKKELDSLAVVANSWRKQEMNSLKDLFTENSKKHIKSAAVGWLHLFEIMKHFTSTKSCKLKMSEILTSVEEFVQSSSMGQFETRLAILRMFYMHLLIHDVLHKPTQKRHLMLKALAAMLQNLHSYYSQVLSPVKEQNLNGTNELSKELADFIRLAKWEDINVYAMRNNIEKANRTVVKLRQKHDAILGNGIKAFFDSQANKIGFSGLASVKEKKAKHIFSLLSEYLQFKYVSHFQTTRLENVTIPQSVTGPISPELKRCLAQGQRDLYRRKLPNLVAKSSKLLRPLFVNKHLSGYWLNVAESIDDSAFQIAHRATQLRALDKPAKMQKQKALSDLFKMLKNLGLSNARKIISLKGSFLKYFKTPSSVSISMVCNNILDKALSENAREIFTKSERYFFQSLSAYQELSMLAGDYHEDIQGSEFESMVAYLQSLLDACFQLRSLLESSSRGNSVICALLETMKAFSGHINDFDALESKPGNNQDVRTWLWDIHAACQFTSELLQDSKLLLKGSKNPSNFDVHIPGVEIMIEQSEKCTQGIEELLLPKSCKVETMSEIVQLYSKNSKKKNGLERYLAYYA